MITDRQLTVTLFGCVRLFILIGGSLKIRIRLCSTVARSGDIVLFGVYLFLHYVYPNDLDNPRQDNSMI